MKVNGAKLAFLFLCCAAISYAQQSITGTVTDSTGALVANAKVTVTLTDTGATTPAQTTNSGNFNASGLGVGKYTVVIEAKGFKTFRREKIQLDAGQIYRVDAKLEVGSEAQTVTVTADASLLHTDSEALTYNLTLKDLQELPFFNIQGGAIALRDPYAAAQMVPGVRYVANSIMMVNGLPQDQVQYRIDGQVTGLITGGTSIFGFQSLTGLTQPSPDAVEEIAITTSNFTAEFGSVGGALFNVTMKSGTNQYHGSAYDYIVNEALNARDPNSHTRNKNRRNNWGFTFGGPIKIPWVYDGTNKTFFFWSLDYLSLKSTVQSGVNNSQTVPTDAYRAGDFSSLPGLSTANPFVGVTVGTTTRNFIDPFGNPLANGTLYNPASYRLVPCDKVTVPTADCTAGSQVPIRDPILNNNLLNAQIVSPTTGQTYTGIDPVALKILKLIPEPTLTTSPINNYFQPYSDDRTNMIPSLKLDHNITSSSRISLTMQETWLNEPRFLPDGFPNPITQASGNKDTAPQIRANYDQTLTPTIQLHLGAGWTQFDLDRQLDFTFDPATQIGFTGTFAHTYFPRFDANTSTVPAWGGMNGMGTNGGTALTLERHPSGTASLTWIRGSHTMKFGAEWREDMLPHYDPSYSDGHFSAFTASTGVTGNPITSQQNNGTVATANNSVGFSFANFLLGGAQSFDLRSPIDYRTSKFQYGAYVQDSWRASRKLTVDLGIRWDMGTYTKEDFGRAGAFDPTIPNPVYGNRLGAIQFEAVCKCQFAKNYPYGIGPRVGFAYTLNPKTVFRGGFGWSYGSTGAFGGYESNANPTPSVQAFFPTFLMRDGVPASLTPKPWPGAYSPSISQTGPAPVGFNGLGFQYLDPNAGRPSRTLQWNIALQRELSRNLVIEAAYVANRGVWQSNSSLEDINSITLSRLQQYGFDPYTAADFGILQLGNNGGTSALVKSRLATAGIVAPYGGFPANVNSIKQQFVPFPQYGTSTGNGTGTSAINPQRAPMGKSWYDSLQLSLNKRYSHGLMVNTSYTLSKNLSSAIPVDINNPDYQNKDLAGINVPQYLRVTFQYQTPRPPSYVPVLGQRWVSHALEGWGVSMSLRYTSGSYIGRPTSGASQAITTIFGGAIGAQIKTDPVTGAPMNPWSVDWIDLAGNHHTDPLDINCRCFDPLRTQVLNPNAWTSAPNLAWPSQTQQLPNFRGPRLPTEAGNISRTFRFGKEGRVNLNVRAEFQNIFNRLLLPAVPTVGAFTTGISRSATTGAINSGFGIFPFFGTVTYGTPRQGTFVGRVTF